MNGQDLARRTIQRLNNPPLSEDDRKRFEQMTDEELDAFIANCPPLSDEDRKHVNRITGGRTDALSELTIEELDRIIAGEYPY